MVSPLINSVLFGRHLAVVVEQSSAKRREQYQNRDVPVTGIHHQSGHPHPVRPRVTHLFGRTRSTRRMCAVSDSAPNRRTASCSNAALWWPDGTISSSDSSYKSEPFSSPPGSNPGFRSAPPRFIADDNLGIHQNKSSSYSGPKLSTEVRSGWELEERNQTIGSNLKNPRSKCTKGSLSSSLNRTAFTSQKSTEC